MSNKLDTIKENLSVKLIITGYLKEVKMLRKTKVILNEQEIAMILAALVQDKELNNYYKEKTPKELDQLISKLNKLLIKEIKKWK